ncbi:uncharacterized protein OCT59_015574 [Rhizophagus irregularis]|uniref:Uncharacterized protein n=3 Tax=Rhizophagus irregularis TaxID=588596 RepID=A0A015NCH6_RHIIW|nr:hypothetical protein RirG_028540 [Rhizophagus irregularis DAOM 197198w]UZO23230.1 hypothetical protein OCT59_015574 [Rhizophagus irregularis]GBC18464.1 hypothetical protein RIR_jg5834.t1 [Rhizophagus irregularis DAOM 181602=DAOM 197198]CAG8604068.1 18861_t:CDS:2 [Rhizophagus irregularis]
MSSAIDCNTKRIYSKYRNNQISWEELNRAWNGNMKRVKSPPLTNQPPPSNPEQSSTLTDQPPLSRSIQPPTYEEATSGKSYCRRKHLHDNVSSAIAFNTKIYSKYRNNQIYWEELNRA